MSYTKLGPFIDVTKGATPPPGAVALSAVTLNYVENGIAAAATAADAANTAAANVQASLSALTTTVNAQAATITQLQQALAAVGGGTGGGVVYGTNVDAANLPDGTLVVLLTADPTTV